MENSTITHDKQGGRPETYSRERLPQGFSVAFAAALDGVDRICREIDAFLAGRGLSGSAFDIKLGARETLNNAVVHGSNNDKAKQVFFRIMLDKGLLFLQVADQGPGFDWRSLMQRHVGVLDCSGRGLDILRQYFDAVEFSDSGRCITLVYDTRSVGGD